MTHIDGPPWKIVGHYASYTEADKKRNELQSDPSLQVKVHYMGPSSNKFFAVKTRLDPAQIVPPRQKKKKRRKK